MGDGVQTTMRSRKNRERERKKKVYHVSDDNDADLER